MLLSHWHTDLAIAAGWRMLSQSPSEWQAFSEMILSSVPVSHNATFVFQPSLTGIHVCVYRRTGDKTPAKYFAIL